MRSLGRRGALSRRGAANNEDGIEMGVSDEVIEALDGCSGKWECQSSMAFSESLNAVFFLDEALGKPRLRYEGLASERRLSGTADIELAGNDDVRDIQTIAFNSTCNMLLLKGVDVSVVRVDNRSLQQQQGDQRVVLEGHMLEKGAPNQGVVIVQAAWHPLSAYHVVALVKRGRACYLNVYGLPEHGDLSTAWTDQQIPIKLSGFSAVKDPDDLVSFAFGPVGSGSGWERFTVYIMHRSGHIFALCPVIPGGCKVSREALLELYDMLPEVAQEGGMPGDPDAAAASDVLRKYFPTFDPESPRAGLVESRLPRGYAAPLPQLVHAVEDTAPEEGSPEKQQPEHSFNLSLLNPDGSLPILGVIKGRKSYRLDVGVVLHVIHPGFLPGKWSREGQGMKSLAQVDFQEWHTERAPSIMIDGLRLGTLYVVLSHNIFRADLPIISKVDSHKYVSYGQWSVKDPSVREIVSQAEAKGSRDKPSVQGACLTSRLEGGQQSCLYVRRDRNSSFAVEVNKPEPYLLHNLLQLEGAKEDVAKKIRGSDDSPSMLLSSNKYTQNLEDKVRDGKGLLSQGDQEIMAGVVGPRRWLEIRMADRIQEITAAILADQEDSVRKLEEKLKEQSAVKDLQTRYSDLAKALKGSGEELDEVGKGIETLRSRMTMQERHAKQALEVAEKRLERLAKAWNKVKSQVTRRVEGEVTEDATLSEKLAALNLKQQQPAARGGEAAEDARAALEELQSGVSRIDRLLTNLEERTTSVGVVVSEELFDNGNGSSTPSRP